MHCRVSEIETFRRWREDPDADLDDILPRLRGEEPPSDRMLAGSALHLALEHAGNGEFDRLQVEYEGEPYVFHFDADAAIELPAIRELRASRTWAVDSGEITVSGQVDARAGRRIDDHKTTGQFDPEGYLAGYQWRLYLEIHDADHFRWNVLEIREASDRFLDSLADDLRALPGRHYVVHGSHRLEQYRYPGMADDCMALVTDFYRFARQHLPERFTDPTNQKAA